MKFDKIQFAYFQANFSVSRFFYSTHGSCLKKGHVLLFTISLKDVFNSPCLGDFNIVYKRATNSSNILENFEMLINDKRTITNQEDKVLFVLDVFFNKFC